MNVAILYTCTQYTPLEAIFVCQFVSRVLRICKYAVAMFSNSYSTGCQGFMAVNEPSSRAHSAARATSP